MHKDVKKILISEEEIVKRCEELGRQITADYEAKQEAPLLVGLLKGSVPFLAELIKHIDMDIMFDFMDVSSYEGTQSDPVSGRYRRYGQNACGSKAYAVK